MPTITAIQVRRRGSKSRLIEVDGEPWRSASVAVIAAVGVEEGDVVDLTALAGALAELEPRLARDRALRLLSYRDRSKQVLTERLVEDGYPAEVAGDVVARLERIGFVDDIRLAGNLARTLVEIRGLGPTRVSRELSRAGIPDDVARDAMSEHLTSESEREAADRIARTAARRSGATVDKVAARLARKGYRPSVALAAARDAFDADPSSADIRDDSWTSD